MFSAPYNKTSSYTTDIVSVYIIIVLCDSLPRGVACLQDLDHLEGIWELTQEWNMAWDSWKVGTFASLQTDDMGYQAQVMLKKLNKIAREVKVSHKAGISPSLGNNMVY